MARSSPFFGYRVPLPVDEAGKRLDGERGAHDYEEVAFSEVIVGVLEELLGQAFAKEDDVGLDDAVAVVARRNDVVVEYFGFGKKWLK